MIINTQHDKFIEQIIALSADTKTEKKQEYRLFQELYFNDVSDKSLSDIGPDKAAFITRKQWALAQTRKPQEVLLQIYNPSMKQDGWDSEFTHINIIADDKPFLIDSVSLALNQLGYTLKHVFHPIFNINRENHDLTAVSSELEHENATNESFMHFIIDKVIDEEAEKAIAKTLLSVLKDVEYSVDDWPANRGALLDEIKVMQAEHATLGAEAQKNVAEYLQWLADDNFIILGSAVFSAEKKGKQLTFSLNDTSRLGLLKSQGSKSYNFDFSEACQGPVKAIDDVLVLSKSALRSTVHRTVYCDTVSVKRFDAKGQVNGEIRFWGLYTSAAYRKNPQTIPVVQDKIDFAFKQSGLSEKTHKGKALIHTLVTYPRDELMSIKSEDLAKFAFDICELSQHQHVSVYMRPDYYNRYVTCLVYIPRDSYDHVMRERVAKVLMEECHVDDYEYLIKITDESLIRLEMLVMLEDVLADKLHLNMISYKIQLAAKTWNDQLHAKMVSESGVIKGNILFNRYKDALPVTYKNACDIDTALADIAMLESMSATQTFDLRVVKSESKQQFNVRLFSQNAFVAPSDTMPIFNNMSVRVLIEEPYKVTYQDEAGNDKESYIHDYTLEYKDGYDAASIENNFKQSFTDIWHKTVENDGLNKLIMAAALSSREVVVFRSVAKYLLQARLPFSQQYIEQTLIDNKNITKKLLELFVARFNPKLHSKKQLRSTQKKIQCLEAFIDDALDDVASLNQDRILRNVLSVIQAIVRTNFYQLDENGQVKPYVSIKLDTSKLLELPDPRPMFEIFVYSSKTEGVHLRGGKVARGGLRWSDRREDFRTEVLGLMKAQMVKNSVIVPVGAKGGFVVKQAPGEGGQEALMAEVVSCYKTFINALLDVTDNLIKDTVVPPQDVVRHDADDTYLVVAADKGTATFSDIANEIAVSRNFWLGDAFASGGSIGYDHKKMGITAKGAWESVKLNFRDLGKDIRKQDFTVVGIGDMGGDVFGNGMLLSKHTCLVAAFNHMHIFIDPTPNAASSYKERKRLFDLPRSSWADYDEKLLSKGGGIFSRSDKVIKLSPQARGALGIENEQLTPEQLINQILKAPVDLLWNGGIGTYIKASYEQNTDVGDKANDGLRVNGNELRCLCVGEGGNLGVTQQGRIEYALQGGRIDTDFIHNAGGVDCSDHEVNIKILLHKLLETDQLTEDSRIELLASMADDVSEAVLLSNYWQGQAITQVEYRGVKKIDEHALYINQLEKVGRLDRALEGLPDNDILHQRKLDGKGLVRPEIAVLISYAKMTGYDELLSSDLWEDQYYSDELVRYFPKELVTAFNTAVHAHPLRKEILSTFIINRMVNRMGPTFAFNLYQEIGASVSDVARAYTIAWESFSLRHLWQSIAALDNKMDASVQTEMMLKACSLIERSSRWLVQHRRKRLGIRETINDYSHGAQALSVLLPNLYADSNDVSIQTLSADLEAANIPDDIASQILAMDDYYCTFDIVELANKQQASIVEVASVYFYVYQAMDVKVLRDKINAVSVENHWQERNRSALIDDLYVSQRDICQSVMATFKNQEAGSAEQQFVHWQSLNNDTIELYQQCLAEFNVAESLDMAMLSVAVRMLAQTTTQPDLS